MALKEKGNPGKIAFLITVDLLTSNYLKMPTNVSDRKGIEDPATELLDSSKQVTIVQEVEERESIVANPPEEKHSAVDAAPEQKTPHFYQHKIRVRKYDFL